MIKGNRFEFFCNKQINIHISHLLFLSNDRNYNPVSNAARTGGLFPLYKIITTKAAAKQSIT